MSFNLNCFFVHFQLWINHIFLQNNKHCYIPGTVLFIYSTYSQGQSRKTSKGVHSEGNKRYTYN